MLAKRVKRHLYDVNAPDVVRILLRNPLCVLHNKVITKTPRIPIVPTHSDKLKFSSVPCLLQKLASHSLLWVFSIIDGSSRKFKKNFLWAWTVLLCENDLLLRCQDKRTHHLAIHQHVVIFLLAITSSEDYSRNLTESFKNGFFF